jgi:hypothetical protein
MKQSVARHYFYQKTLKSHLKFNGDNLQKEMNQSLASATKRKFCCRCFPLSHMAKAFENDTTLYSHASEAILD